jgi:AcrR family transcriptional regulator
MMSGNDARERVLDTAEWLFHERGYNAVSMRDIADELGIRQASLYYHVPEGKEQLYFEVTERGLQRHRKGLDEVVAQAEPNIEARLRAVGRWVMDHAPLKLLSMLETDMPAISEEHAQKLTYEAFQSFFSPLTALFGEAMEKGEIRVFDPNQLAGHFLSLLDGTSYTTISGHTEVPMSELAADMIDIFLNGIRTP